jgi:hypothetical protein
MINHKGHTKKMQHTQNRGLNKALISFNRSYSIDPITPIKNEQERKKESRQRKKERKR